MKLIVSFVTCILLLVLYVVPSHAIPAFTRAHKVECSTCHTIFPELNEYGEAFLKNSYVYFGKGKKKTTVSQKVTPDVVAKKPAAVPVGGADVKGEGNADLLSKLKAGTMIAADAPAVATEAQAVEEGGNHPAVDSDAKPEGLVLSGVPEQLPISLTASIHGTYDRNAVNELDLSTRTVKLNAGGNFREKAAFFGTYVLYTESPVPTNANTSTVPTNLQGKNDIGEMFLVWRHALDTPLNIKVGRFQPKLGLWKSNNKLSTTNSYATYSYLVGSSLFTLEQPQDAVEANMIVANRLFVAGGAVTRKNQNTKEYYAHTSVKFGGADYLTNEPEIDLSKEESVFDFLTMTVGGYGYFGTNGDPNTVAGVTPRQNDYYRAGMDIDLLYKQLRLKLSGVLGKDDNPDLTYLLPAEKSKVAVVEGQYAIMQNLIGALRFEYQDDGSKKVRRYIPTFAYSPIENIKVAAEYKYENGTTSANKGITNKVALLGVTFGF